MINPRFEETYLILSKRYRGLRKESLEFLNPEYSCVICKKYSNCPNAIEKNSCPRHEFSTEDEFSNTYNFNGD